MNADTRWKLAVLELDDYTCQMPGCGANTNLDAAHIIPRRFKATRYDPANGITLCRTHHEQFHQHPREFQSFLAHYLPRR
jgi:predicted restriction endonuclease